MTEEKIKRGPGRPPKDETKVKTVQELPPVRTYMRAISLRGVDDLEAGPGQPPQFVSIQTLENALWEFYRQGYKLLSAEYIGDVQEGTAIRVLYTLVLKEA